MPWLQPHDMVIVEQAELTIDKIRGQLTPAISSSTFPSPDDMPDSEINEVSQVVERCRGMAKSEVPHPSSQVAIQVCHLLLHTERDRMMDERSHFHPEPFLTS